MTKTDIALSFRLLHCAVVVVTFCLPLFICPTSADVIENFLFNQTIALNDTTFVENSIVGNITNLMCYGLSLDTSEARVVGVESLELTLRSKTLSCSGAYVFYEQYLPFVKTQGTVLVIVGPSDMGPLELLFSTDSSGLPRTINVTHCSCTITISDFVFSNTLIEKIADTLKDVLKAVLQAQLSEQVCTHLPDMVYSASKDLQKLDDKLEPYLPMPVFPSPQDVVVPVSDDLLNLATFSPLLTTNKFVSVLAANNCSLINAVMAAATHSQGCISLEPAEPLGLPFAVPMLMTNATFEATSLKLCGLDSFLELELSQPTNYSLHSLIHTARVGLTLQVNVHFEDGPFGPAENYTFNLQADLSDMDLNITAVIAIITSSFTNKTLGQMLLDPNCILNTLSTFNVTQLLFQSFLRNLHVQPISGDFLFKTVNLVNGFAELVMQDYSVVAMELTRGIIGSYARTAFNTKIGAKIREHGECLPYAPPESHDDDIYNFETSQGIALVDEVVNQGLGPEGVNAVMDAFTVTFFGAPGQAPLPGTFSVSIPSPPLAFNASHITMANIDTLTSIQFLEPLGPVTLSNKVTAAMQHRSHTQSSAATSHNTKAKSSATTEIPTFTNGSSPGIGISFQIDMSYMFDDSMIDDSFVIQAAVQALNTSLVANAQLNTTALLLTPLYNMTKVECLLATVKSANISKLTTTVASLGVAITGGSSSFYELLELLFEFMNTELPTNLSIPPGTGDLLNDRVQTILAHAQSVCGSPESPAPETSKWPVGGTIGIVVGCSACVLLVGAVTVHKKRSSNKKTASTFAAQWLLQTSDDISDPTRRMSLQTLTLGYVGPKYALATQLIVVVLLIASLVTKLLSLTMMVARVAVTFFGSLSPATPHKSLFEADLIDFYFRNMVEYFWDSKAYMIAVLIVFGTCFLPVLKIVLLSSLWWLPLTDKRRAVCLGVLDQLGRIAFIDAVFLAEIMILFTVDVKQSNLEMYLRAEPCVAVIIAVASTVGSSFISHCFVTLHTRTLPVSGVPRAPPAPLTTRRRILIHPLTSALVFACVAVPTFMLPLVTVTMGGLAGAVEGSHNVTPVYVLTLPLNLTKSTDSYGVAIFVSVLIMSLVVVGPVTNLVMCIAASLPLPLRWLRRVRACLWFSLSWTGLDVLLLSIIAGALEMNMIAVWIVNNKFSQECSLAEEAFQMPCVVLTTEINAGFPFLVILCLIQFWMLWANVQGWQRLQQESDYSTEPNE
eukprot:c3259_g1_i1.p1 GENE.c3259_g1_i1~~c3259_g1_i1.p1  ORF type:complete len:1236 (+),score=367.85 c3259_g1_i1:107-3814(+)